MTGQKKKNADPFVTIKTTKRLLSPDDKARCDVSAENPTTNISRRGAVGAQRERRKVKTWRAKETAKDRKSVV